MHGTFTMYKGFHVEMIFSITDLELHQIIFWGSVIVCRSIDFLMTGTGATTATPSDIKLHGIPRTSPAFQGLTNCVPTYGVNIIASTNCARQGFVKKNINYGKKEYRMLFSSGLTFRVYLCFYQHTLHSCYLSSAWLCMVLLYREMCYFSLFLLTFIHFLMMSCLI